MCGSLLLGFSWSSFSESVSASSMNFLQMSHTAGTSCLSSLGLGTPVEASDTCTWVATRRTHFLLNVVRGTATTHTQCVWFVVALAKTQSSLCHLGCWCLSQANLWKFWVYLAYGKDLIKIKIKQVPRFPLPKTSHQHWSTWKTFWQDMESLHFLSLNSLRSDFLTPHFFIFRTRILKVICWRSKKKICRTVWSKWQ